MMRKLTNFVTMIASSFSLGLYGTDYCIQHRIFAPVPAERALDIGAMLAVGMCLILTGSVRRILEVLAVKTLRAVLALIPAALSFGHEATWYVSALGSRRSADRTHPATPSRSR